MTTEQNDASETAVYHPDCSRCGDPVVHATGGTMCSDCIRETPSTDECSICSEYNEKICGYHATCLWYCPDCGAIRRVGNRPSRPGSDDRVGCYNHPVFDEESHWMVRLTYESTAEKRLRNYINGGAEA